MNQTNYTYLEDFKSMLRARKFQPESIRSYCADIQQYFEWLTDRELASPLGATVQDAQEYVAFLNLPTHILRAGKIGAYSAATIARKVKTLRYLYDFISESKDK